MLTWRRGRRVLWGKLYGHALTARSFVDKLDPKLIRVPGTAVFMTGNPSPGLQFVETPLCR
jgi:K+ transporter